MGFYRRRFLRHQEIFKDCIPDQATFRKYQIPWYFSGSRGTSGNVNIESHYMNRAELISHRVWCVRTAALSGAFQTQLLWKPAWKSTLTKTRKEEYFYIYWKSLCIVMESYLVFHQWVLSHSVVYPLMSFCFYLLWAMGNTFERWRVCLKTAREVRVCVASFQI